MNLDYRVYQADALRALAPSADAPSRLVGHAAMFNALSDDLGGFREQIAPGAFARSLAEHDQRALWQHDPKLVLGRRGAGTLRIAEDDQGLAIEIDLPDTTWGRDAAVSIARGDVMQMSFGFRAVADQWENRGGVLTRTLLDVDLLEVSPVTFPAYSQTDVSARSLDALRAAQAIHLHPPAPPDYSLLRARLRVARARST